MTLDAMGCQREIARKIVGQGADYVLAVKAKQERLYEDVVQFMDTARGAGFRGVSYDDHEAVDKGQGRMEVRRYWLSDDVWS